MPSSSSNSSRSLRRSRNRRSERTSITILVLGDEGVGKSSLISTFVSRYFPETVPGVMTRVRLPPDPGSSCTTMIVDSQGGDTALASAISAMSVSEAKDDSSATATTPLQRSLSSNATQTHTQDRSYQRCSLGGLENVDSVIMVYDLSRMETFERMENHWLPLIERCFNGELPVIVAGTKLDLAQPISRAPGLPPDDQALARSRQQIVSLLQRFRFIRQCIKCSAKGLVRVDDVFLKAQQAVLYPFTPLYDLDVGQLTAECRRALTRIFRIYDRDCDGLLSHSEIDEFQYKMFRVPVYERDLGGWKKAVSRNNPTNEEVIRDGKFTVAGFLVIFDVFINQNRLDVPWQVLRASGYDDNLKLDIPSHISTTVDDDGNQIPWCLTAGARHFLAKVFYQFDSDKDGTLSAADIETIFSIIPQPSLPPWHPYRASMLFRGCFSAPKQYPSVSTTSPGMSSPDSPRSESSDGHTPLNLSDSLSASGITIVSGETFPTLLSGAHHSPHPETRSLTYCEWMSLWHSLSAISPSVAREELYRLGYDDKIKRSKHKRKSQKTLPSDITPDARLPSREYRVLVVGSRQCGKTALLNGLCGLDDAMYTTKTTSPETSCTFIKMKHHVSSGNSESHQNEEFVVHFSFTEVPEARDGQRDKQTKDLSEIISQSHCDLTMLVFNATSEESLSYAKEIEETLLIEDSPRVFVATNLDGNQGTDHADVSQRISTIMDEANEHCRDLDLEPPLKTSAKRDSDSGTTSYHDALDHFARCCFTQADVNRLRSRPHEEKKRREATRRRARKIMWLGAFGVAAAAAVVGYFLTGATRKGSASDRKSGGFGWFRNLFPSSSQPIGGASSK